MTYPYHPLRGMIVLFVDADSIAAYNKLSSAPADVTQVHSVRDIDILIKNVRLEGVKLRTTRANGRVTDDKDGSLRWSRFGVLMLPPDESYYVNRIEEEGGEL